MPYMISRQITSRRVPQPEPPPAPTLGQAPAQAVMRLPVRTFVSMAKLPAAVVASGSGSWWKIALGVAGGVAGVGLLSFVGWKLYKRRKGAATETLAPVSDFGVGPEFFQTVMGRQFYEGTMPSIAKSLQSIAASLRKQTGSD